METGCAGAEHMVLSFRLAKVECKGWGKSTRGLGINRGLMVDIAAEGVGGGGEGPIVRPSTLTLFRYSKDGHCAIFSCVSPRCCRH